MVRALLSELSDGASASARGRTRVVIAAPAEDRQLGAHVEPVDLTQGWPFDLAQGRQFAAGHPVPNDASEAAATRALEIVSAAAPADRCVALISGGASALLCRPAGRLTLDDKRAATRVLLAAGADIHALNIIRKHLSSIKGGRLAAAARAPMLTLAISDVAGVSEDDPSVIGSGPTVADASTYADALDAAERLDVLDALPAAVLDHLRRGARGEEDESPKPGDPRLTGSRYSLIGSRHDAMRGAADAAERLGYRTMVIRDAITGEARTAAAEWWRRACVETSGSPGRCCVISTGETTVRVRGRGRGGRNQEFALALVDAIASVSRSAALASVGTDGVDGPTDAAGAFVDSMSVTRAQQQGLASPAAYLDDNDSYSFFNPIGDLIRLGATGTNVGDLQVLLLA